MPTWNLNEDQLDSKGNALVVCYTNAKSVELRAKKSVDDSDYISLGTKKFNTLKSSAGLREYNVNSDENATGCNELRKAGEASKISLSKYQYKNNLAVSSDDYNLYYINVDIKDENDLIADTYDGNIELSIEGNAQIIGVDNGNSSDTDKSKYSDTIQINAFHGKALVIVKASKESAFSLYTQSGNLSSYIEVQN